MSQIKILLFIISLAYLQACSTTDKIAQVTPLTKETTTVEKRTISSDVQTSTPTVPATTDLANKPAIQNGESDTGGGESSEGSSAGRKIVIPQDQEGLAKKCNDAFENRPEFLKGQANDRKAFNAYNYTIKHRAYEVSYNFYHLNPNWIYHRIHRENLKNSCGKRDKGFYADSDLYKVGVPQDLVLTDKSFKGSGFDRGHMAPSADFLWNQEINKESFFMTNMSPQTPGLNQHTWQKLEDRIRKWACGNGELEVYTGPVLEQGLQRLESCASIPKKYYKVLAYYKNGKHHGIAFLYPQTDQPKDGDPFQKRALSIRQLEELTGQNFFNDKYSKEVQDSFETAFDIKDWAGTEDNCAACNGKLKQGD
jgi:endonuclease G